MNKISGKYRMTPQRNVILEELRKVKTHPTANEIYQMVIRRIPNISLGTVYRNLEILSESGMIRKLEICGQQNRYDGCVAPHYHIRCVRCGRIDDVDRVTGEIPSNLSCEAEGYEVRGVILEFLGICEACLRGDSGRRAVPFAGEGVTRNDKQPEKKED